MRRAFVAPVNWDDFEFIREAPSVPAEEVPVLLTGWELIVFELEDEETEG
jgi:hypothetical protein